MVYNLTSTFPQIISSIINLLCNTYLTYYLIKFLFLICLFIQSSQFIYYELPFWFITLCQFVKKKTIYIHLVSKIRLQFRQPIHLICVIIFNRGYWNVYNKFFSFFGFSEQVKAKFIYKCQKSLKEKHGKNHQYVFKSTSHKFSSLLYSIKKVKKFRNLVNYYSLTFFLNSFNQAKHQ